MFTKALLLLSFVAFITMENDTDNYDESTEKQRDFSQHRISNF